MAVFSFLGPFFSDGVHWLTYKRVGEIGMVPALRIYHFSPTDVHQLQKDGIGTSVGYGGWIGVT